MKKTKPHNLLKTLIIAALAILLSIALLVIFFDPFYHYHKPLPFLKAVLNDKEYQVPGTLDHFDYNAVIAGSSVSENYNNHWFDEEFDCTSVKAIRSYGATADLCYYVNRAFEHQKLDYVFWNLDPTSLSAEPKLTFEESGLPMYLYDTNPFNDVEYLFNKDVLFKRIPYQIASSFMRDYDEGESYNWYSSKTFSEEEMLSHYTRSETGKEMLPSNHFETEAEANVKLITDIVASHPETKFYIFIPPYSIVWWDATFRDGTTDAYLSAEEYAMKTLIKYDNVYFFNFQEEAEIIHNLDNYMDALHFDPKVNHYMVKAMKIGITQIKDDSMVESSLQTVSEYAHSAEDYVSGILRDDD